MNKKNLILGGILVLLIIFAWAWGGPISDWRQKSSQEKNFLSGLSSSKIIKIEIDKGGSQTVLEKSGDRFKVGGTKDFYLKKEVADELTFALDKAASEKIEAVSGNKDKKDSFGTDDSGIKVRISEEGKTFEFVVGKATTDLAGAYLSQANSDKTYKVGVDLNAIFSRSEWRDDTIFSFLKERVNKLRLQYPNRHFFVLKTDNKWNGESIVGKPSKFNVNQQKIEDILAVLEDLKAAKIPDQKFDGTGLEKHSLIAQATGEGVDATLMVGDCTSEGFCYAKRSDSDNIYMIKKAERDTLDRWQKDLK